MISIKKQQVETDFKVKQWSFFTMSPSHKSQMIQKHQIFQPLPFSVHNKKSLNFPPKLLTIWPLLWAGTLAEFYHLPPTTKTCAFTAELAADVLTSMD